MQNRIFCYCCQFQSVCSLIIIKFNCLISLLILCSNLELSHPSFTAVFCFVFMNCVELHPFRHNLLCVCKHTSSCRENNSYLHTHNTQVASYTARCEKMINIDQFPQNDAIFCTGQNIYKTFASTLVLRVQEVLGGLKKTGHRDSPLTVPLLLYTVISSWK